MNLAPLLSQLTIRTKAQSLVNLEPNWAQHELLEVIQQAHAAKKPARIIVLKARQLGISTIAEALLFIWAVAFKNTNSCVVSHDGDSAENLFEMTKLYYETFPFKSSFPSKYATRRQLQFAGQGSNIWVMTAQNVAAGRGRTIHALHASEVAFWDEPTEAMLALNQTVPSLPGTVMILESTANGVGNWFEEQWSAAKSGQNDYVPLFFPWWKEPSYIPCQGYFCLDGTCDNCQLETKALGRKFDEDERDLIKMGADRTHLAWRRWAISNKCFGSLDLFHQEYPSTDTEAFLVSGVNAFPEPHLRQCFEAMTPQVGRLVRDETEAGGVRFIADATGPLRVYRHPSSDKRWGKYFIGADACYGVVDGDFAAAQVINRHNKEQVAVWHGRMNPIAFADELAKLGAYYNMAMIAPETEGPGYGTIGRLVSIYNNLWRHKLLDRWPGKQESVALGWSSNWKRKQWIIMKLGELLERNLLVMHDRRTFNELRGYAFYGTTMGDVFRPGVEDAHDDLVMSLAICLVCESTEPSPDPFELEPARPDGLIFGEPIEKWDEESIWTS